MPSGREVFLPIERFVLNMRATDFIGNTPLVRLQHLSTRYTAEVYAKLEFFNPGGSIKDRTAWSLVQDAVNRGQIHSDTVLIEATSGNTGIALAMVAAVMRLKLVVFMPEGQSIERKQLFWAYGATIIETPQAERTQGAIDRAKDLEQRMPHGLMLRQHENPANPRIHQETTGPEIWQETQGFVTAFVAGVGTGGTVTGVGQYLKEQNPSIRIVAVEPAGSAVLSGKPPGSHKIQGIGPGFVPKVLDRSVIDDVVAVPDEGALEMIQLIPRQEGILVGLSSAAAYWATESLLQQGLRGTIVMMFPDSGERYLSTGIYTPTDSEWVSSYLK